MLLNIDEYAEVSDGDGGSGNLNETIKKSLYACNSNKKTGHQNLGARKAFTKLKQAFTQVAILQHLDPE